MPNRTATTGTSGQAQAVAKARRKGRRLQTTPAEARQAYPAIDGAHAVTILNPDATIRHQSQGMQMVFGYSADELVGKDIAEFLHPDDVKTAIDGLGTIAESPGQTISMEMRFLHKDGSWHTVQGTGTNLLDDPEVGGIMLDYQDITQQKRLEEALWLNENAIENALNAMVMTDIQGTITYVNQACLRLWRAEKEDFLGKGFWELVDMQERSLTDEIATTMMETGSWEGEIAARRKDGSDLYVRALTSLAKDQQGTPVQTITSFVDVTEKKTAEVALRQSEWEYAALLSNVPDAVFRYRNGVMTWANDRIEEMLGYTRDELVGKAADLFVADDVSLTQVEETVGAGIKEHGHFHGIIRAKRKDGDLVDIEYTASPVRGKRPVEIVGVARDITERKRAEEEKERLTAELAEKNADQEQIIYVTSHDLRSPLVNIQGFSKELKYSLEEVASIVRSEEVPSHLREKASSIIESEIPDALNYIEVSISKMDLLLSGLLRLSRLGRAALNFEQLNMNLLMVDITKAFEYRLKESGVSLQIDDLPSCRGDFVQINQVFSNLLDNALKYLDPGRPGIIKVAGERLGDDVVYRVEDNGIGIAPEHQTKVFEIFHQLNPASSSGEGLGLSIVKKIVSRHGGRTWVESEQGAGSKFFVSLPADDRTT